MLTRQRIILLPGFGEDGRIFRHIVPHLNQYELLIPDYRDVLPAFSTENIRLSRFVHRLIRAYRITSQDILIGHSLGGFFAHNIRQMVGCPICLHSSFTSPSKIKILVRNQFLVKQSIMNGFFSSQIFKTGGRTIYGNRPSREDLENVLEILDTYGKENIYKLTLLFFKRKKRFMNWLRSKPDYTFAPNLVFHPENDNILATPDEAYYEVSGDHFSIATHPNETLPILMEWLESLQTRLVIPIRSNTGLQAYKTAI